MTQVSFWNDVAGRIVAALFDSLVAGLVLSAGVWLFFRLARKVNAATRHVIWWAVLFAVLAVPVVRWLPHSTPDSLPAISAAGTDLEVAPPQDVPVEPTVSREPDPTSRFELPFQISAGYAPLVLMLIWLALAAVQISRLVSSYRHMRRLKASAEPVARDLAIHFAEWVLATAVGRDARLLTSKAVRSPIAAGFRRPAVIVPAGIAAQLQQSDLDHVMLHELAHLSRRDDWTNLAARLLCAIFFFHPVLIWILRRIEAEREIACDDWVVSITGEPRRYAASLSRLVTLQLTNRRELLATGIGGRHPQILNRIERLVKSTVFNSRTSIALVAVTIVTLAGISMAGARRPQWVAFAQSAAPVPEAPTPVLPAVPQPAELASPAPVPVAPASVPRPTKVPRQPRPAMSYAAALAPPEPPPPPPQKQEGSFLAALVDAGYKDLSVEEIIQLKSRGMSASFLHEIKDTGWGKLPPKDLLRLQENGVTARYLREVKAAGIRSLTIEDTIQLRQHGVSAEMIRDIHALGFGPYAVNELISFVNNGARVPLFRGLRDAGFTNARPEEILDASRNGLNESDLREAKQLGSGLTLANIIRLKRAGVI